MFSIHFIIGPISYKKDFQTFESLYLGQKTAGEDTFASPDTHNSPHQRGEKKHFENYQKLLNL